MGLETRLRVQRAVEKFAIDYPGSRLTASSVARTLEISPTDSQDALAWMAESQMLDIVVEPRCLNSHVVDADAVDGSHGDCSECGPIECFRFVTYKPTDAFTTESADAPLSE